MIFIRCRAKDVLGQDDFDPAEHPHQPAGTSKGGQFAPTGTAGGGSASEGAASTPAGKYIVNSHVGLVLKKFNYVKGPDENGNMVFHGPNGHKVVIHPPEAGKKSSSKWTAFKPDAPGITKVGIQLENYLAKFHAASAAEMKKEEAAAKTPTEHNAIAAKEHGFKAVSEDAVGTKIYEHPNGAKLYLYWDGTWGMISPDKEQTSTGQPHELKEVLKKSFEHQANPQEEATEKVNKLLATKGLKLISPPKSAFATFSNEAGFIVTWIKEGPNTGKWTSQSKGHMAKEGRGFESLEALLTTGKIMPGVTNIKPTPAPAPKPEVKPHAAHVALFKELQQAAVAPTSHQYGAVSDYKGSGYHQMNDCLRYKEPCSDQDVKKVKAWLDSNSLPKDITVWRGVKGDYAKILRSIAMVGTRFTDRGFLSTSTKSDFSSSWGSGGLLLKINAKKGLKGAVINQNYVDNEYEVLFQAGSIMTVTSYDPTTKIMEVELSQE